MERAAEVGIEVADTLPPEGSVILTTLQTSTSPLWLQIATSPPLLEASSDGSWPSPAPAETCPPSWQVAVCDCRTKLLEAGCNRLDCRRCADFLRRRRSRSIEDRFERGRGGKAVVYTILTVPPSKRREAADRDTFGRWCRRIRKWMKDRLGLLFGVERMDPAGDQQPSLWHPHLNILWVQRDGFRPFIDVDELRTEWARILNTPQVDVWTQYSDEPGRLRHWYSYMGRTWADWRKSVPEHLTIRWLGKYPKGRKDGATFCPHCLADVRYLKVGSEAEAKRYVQLGPVRCRDEIDWKEADKMLGRLSIAPPEEEAA